MTLLKDLLTPELIEQLKSGEITIDQIEVEIPNKKAQKSKELKENEEFLYIWLEAVAAGKTPDDFVPEFWYVLELLCHINLQDGDFDLIKEEAGITETLLSMDAEYTTFETIQCLAKNMPRNNKFLRACVGSSLIVKPRKQKEVTPVATTVTQVVEADVTPFNSDTTEMSPFNSENTESTIHVPEEATSENQTPFSI